MSVDALALALVRGVGSVRYRELAGAAGGALAALERVGGSERARARDAAERALARLAALGGHCLVLGAPEYPAPLLDLPDPPPVLFALGDLAWLARPPVAIVGTRKATPHGARAAQRLARALGSAGVPTVSGLALGIDAAAHEGALAAGTGTVAVLGTGVDLVYPRANRRLYEEVRAHGLLLSELLPGDPADPGSFPRRNRLIAALAPITVVVEAPFRSGALITAEHALELGRTVAVVPGPIDVAACAGSNQLLRDGAQVICGADDLLQLAGVSRPRGGAAAAPPADDAERRVWETLALGPAELDDLVAATGLPTATCVAAVGRLELGGRVACELTGQIRRAD